MAFAQQQRRPRYRSHLSETDSEDLPNISPVQSSSSINHVLSPGPIQSITAIPTTSTASSTSQSEIDWHVVSTGLRSPSSTITSSTDTPTSQSSPSHFSLDQHDSMEPLSSDLESFSSFRHSDTESFSDIDFAFDVLPSHDGTGAFMEGDVDQTSEEDTIAHDHRQQLLATAHLDSSTSSASASQHALVQRNKNTTITSRISASFGDFAPNTPNMPNILLPYGGIHTPSFATNTNTNNNNSNGLANTPYCAALGYPTFHPTVILKDLAISSDENPSNTLSGQQEDSSTSTTTIKSSADHIKLTRKRRMNLDSISTHHPSLSGTMTSFAIISALWNNLRRLTNHLIENDTHTADAFTSLVSEATLDGCLPFGSHLHMELAAGLRPTYSNRRPEGLPGM